MINGITYYKLNEDYHYSLEDVTKNDSLTGSEIDNNFNILEGRDISSIKVSEDKKKLQIVLINHEVIESPNILNDLADSLDFSYNDESGILTIDINDGDDTIQVEGFVTLNDVVELMNEHFVTTDGTLTGNGTMFSPLSIARAHRTGTIKPIDDVVDELPDPEEEPIPVGARYITREENNIDGKFYNFKGLTEVIAALEEEDNGWHVPTKPEWDALLNAMEPDPMDRTHWKLNDSTSLGKMANTLLADDNSGFELRYCGYANKEQEMHLSYVGQQVYFWTGSSIMNKPICENSRNAYIKRFTIGEEGVYQNITDNTKFCSIRLVKKCSNSETVTAAEILGTTYPVNVMRSATGDTRMWTTVNLNYDTEDSNVFEGAEEYETRFYVNEWDGEKWIKSTLDDYIMFYLKSTNEICFAKEGDITPIPCGKTTFPILTLEKGENEYVYNPGVDEDITVSIPTSINDLEDVDEHINAVIGTMILDRDIVVKGVTVGNVTENDVIHAGQSLGDILEQILRRVVHSTVNENPKVSIGGINEQYEVGTVVPATILTYSVTDHGSYISEDENYPLTKGWDSEHGEEVSAVNGILNAQCSIVDGPHYTVDGVVVENPEIDTFTIRSEGSNKNIGISCIMSSNIAPYNNVNELEEPMTDVQVNNNLSVKGCYKYFCGYCKQPDSMATPIPYDEMFNTQEKIEAAVDNTQHPYAILSKRDCAIGNNETNVGNMRGEPNSGKYSLVLILPSQHRNITSTYNEWGNPTTDAWKPKNTEAQGNWVQYSVDGNVTTNYSVFIIDSNGPIMFKDIKFK